MNKKTSRLQLNKESVRTLTTSQARTVKGAAIQDSGRMSCGGTCNSYCRWSWCHHSLCDSCDHTDCCMEPFPTKVG